MTDPTIRNPPDDAGTENVDESERLDGMITVSWSANDSTALPEGYDAAAYTVHSNHADNNPATFADVSATAAAADSMLARFTPAPDTAFMVRVVATATDTDGSGENGATLDPIVINSATVTVGAVDPMASAVTATMDVTTDTTVADTLAVTWKAVTNTNSDFRVVVQVTAASLGGNTVWLVADGTPADPDGNTRSWMVAFGENNANVATWDVAAENGPADVTLTTAEIQAATMLRVDSRQSATAEWKAGTAVAITPKPSG